MTAFTKFKEKFFGKVASDVVGIYWTGHLIQVTRLKKTAAGIQLAGAEVIHQSDDFRNASGKTAPINLSSKTRGKYAALCCCSLRDAFKLLRVPESFDTENREDLIDRLGIDSGLATRISHRVLLPGAAKSEGRVLVGAMLEEHAVRLMQLMPASGMPAARSLELAELSVMNAFLNDPRFANSGKAFGLIHFDDSYSLIALFNEGILSQFRVFPFGVTAVLGRVMSTLNVDQSTAEGILIDGAFDLSHLFEESFRDIRSQLVITRDFMERSEDCILESLSISGPASLTRPFVGGMPAQENITEWNVLEPYPEITPGSLPDEFLAEPWRAAAAIGAALGLLVPQ